MLVRGLAVLWWQSKLPSLEVTGVVQRSEDLHGDASLGGLLAEGVGSGSVSSDEVELERVADLGGAVHLSWEGDALELAQPPLGDGVVVAMLLEPLLQEWELRLDDRGRDLVHSQRKVGGLELELVEHGVVLWAVGGREVALVKHLVGAGGEDAPDGNLLVVGDKEATLSRVDELVGLGAEAGGDGAVLGGAGLDALPVAAERVRAVLDQGDVVLLTHLGDAGHVGDAASHVRDNGDLGSALDGLLLKVLDVDHELLGAVDVLWLAPGVHDGAGDGREGEGVGQDLGWARDLAEPLLLLLEDGKDGQEDGRPAGVEGDAVLVSGDVGEGPLDEGDVVDGLVLVVGALGESSVSEHLSRLHDLAAPLDALLWDGHGALDGHGQPGLGGVDVEDRLGVASERLGVQARGLGRLALDAITWHSGDKGGRQAGVLLWPGKGETEAALAQLATVLTQLRSTKSRHACFHFRACVVSSSLSLSVVVAVVMVSSVRSLSVVSPLARTQSMQAVKTDGPLADILQIAASDRAAQLREARSQAGTQKEKDQETNRYVILRVVLK
mmetsp:Transcript_2069/g.4841  ORF Transcript_2069/g.4841 Transcript_2069/m.4841 type:complete len:555 (+) Transcript_2069:304-1968(+)